MPKVFKIWILALITALMVYLAFTNRYVVFSQTNTKYDRWTGKIGELRRSIEKIPKDDYSSILADNGLTKKIRDELYELRLDAVISRLWSRKVEVKVLDNVYQRVGLERLLFAPDNPIAKGTTMEFPDNMTKEQMLNAIRRTYYGGLKPEKDNRMSGLDLIMVRDNLDITIDSLLLEGYRLNRTKENLEMRKYLTDLLGNIEKEIEKYSVKTPN
ncbi:MAG: hypothetical protein RBG1_1C00001G1506 [candidate division Zixibacteria bacterium RBG-1]|nr:MAG: hypothetical protein RBG1_1C00001G1506 [candidate division Zixibacteria bacterium RBG-1]OGC85792.1 MAG: hypothetical protein A2V73_08370 [candidate division Zixibacteria bacterium RBG_19FT_COMBO_42_43]